MSAFEGKTLAEKIVLLFEERVSEAHHSAIEYPLGISEEEFRIAVPRARDLGVEKGLRITPVYEREGWWTARPTQRIAALAVHETLKRNLGEAERHARVYANFGDLDSFGKWDRAAMQGRMAAYLQNLGQIEVSADSDYILTCIDSAVGAGKGYVELEEAAA